MTSELERNEDRRGIGTGTALLLGLGIGIIGTVVVVAANEERFHNAVCSTKKKAKRIGKEVHDRIDEVRNNSRSKGAEAAYAVERKAKEMGEKLSE